MSLALEDFEDGTFDIPGATIANGAIASPSPLTDSVDEDDGAIDGSGSGGHSYVLQSPVPFVLVFAGSLPTHVGVVWTDVGVTTGTHGVADVVFRAFDSSEVLVGEIGPVTLGDGSTAGATAEDRFFGVEHAGGIARVEMAMPESADWEIDHVQVAFAPEPEGGALLLAALVALAVRKGAGFVLSGNSRSRRRSPRGAGVT
jgi:hypothetical protein